jgi:hypothetical protein
MRLAAPRPRRATSVPFLLGFIRGEGNMADKRVRGGRGDGCATWRVLVLPCAAVIALAGCKDDKAGGSVVDPTGQWKDLDPGTLDTGGGAAVDLGGRGAPGGNIDVITLGSLSFGAALATAADVPVAPAGAMKVSALDADVSIAGPAVIDGNLTIGGDGARRVTVTGGDLYVTGNVRSADAAGAGRALTIEAPAGTIYVSGTIDAGGSDATGQPGGALALKAARVVVTGTLATAGGSGGAAGGPAGGLRIDATGDVMLVGSIKTRGGPAPGPAADAQGGAAAALTIEASGNVQLGGRVDLRGGPARASAAGGVVVGGAGGGIAIGATVAPASVTFAVDVSLDGGDGHGGAGAGGNLTAKASGDFTLAGRVSAHGGSIAEGGNADGGLGGNFVMDIVSVAGGQIYHPGSIITLDGGGSGGTGIAGGGGQLYARSWDGNVSMAGTLEARGGAARDDGGSGGLGGHVNIFSDANYDGVGGDLTVTPEGVIDVSGGAGSIGGSARNDGTFDVASFPDDQHLIAVLLNSDGLHGTPQNGVCDNQGRILARGGAGGGAGGDIGFHGEGTNGLHDPLSGHVEMNGDNGAPDGQWVGE